MAKRKIDLSGHKNPEGFLEDMRKRYPDENVSLSLEGKNLWVEVDSSLHTQEQINIFSFLSERAREHECR